MGTSAEELNAARVTTTATGYELAPDNSSESIIPAVEGENLITPKATLVDQSTIFQNEGLAGFMYRGGQSLEVKITNKGTTSFKWVLIAPDGSRLNTGTLQEGKVMRWNYPDVDTPNGFYSLYVYNAGGEGIVELFARNIEFK